MQLDPFRPSPHWFRHAPGGIHGISHATRVLVWAEHIADWLEATGVALDRTVVRCAAITHDVGRVDDGKDPEHGARSARWVMRHADQLPVPLTPQQLEAVRYCCEWHVPSDAACPQMTEELRCLKDADGLDRVRIYDLNPKYLRTAGARQLEARAWDLLHETEHGEGDPWERVRMGALRLGLWR